jgi:hypothetical protein
MITQIFGGPGTGKTSLMTVFALEHMTGLNRFREVRACNGLISTMNKSGYNFSVPEHLVFSNYHIGCRNGQSSYIVDPFRLGMPKVHSFFPLTSFGVGRQKFYEVDLIPPGAFLFIDEGQEVYNSHKDLPPFVSRFYEKHRHIDLNIMIASQRDMLIHINIREIVQRFILVKDLVHERNKIGLIERSIWKYYEFCDSNSVSRFNDTGDKRFLSGQGEKVFEGNIFRHYDSRGCFPMFFNGAENGKDFKLEKSFAAGIDLSSIIKFNETHQLKIPEGFYGTKN